MIRRFFGAAVLSALLLFVLFRMVSPAELMDTLKRTSGIELLFVTVLYSLVYVLRGWRLKLALPKAGLSSASLAAIVSLHGFLKQNIPFRLGEFSLVYFLRRKADVSVWDSTVVLYVTTIADLLAVFALGVVALAYSLPATGSALLRNALAVDILALTVGFIVYLRSAWALGLATRIVDHWAGPRITKVTDIARTMTDALATYDTGRLVLFVALGCATWLVRSYTVWVFFDNWGVVISFWQASTVMIIVALISALPIQGLGGFGTVEASIIAAMAAIGVPTAEGARISIPAHLITFFLMVFYFVVGILLFARVPDHDRGTEEAVTVVEGG